MEQPLLTPSAALKLMNRVIRALDPRYTYPLRRCRRVLVRRWIQSGQGFQYAANKWIPAQHVGVAVRPDMLLTDNPRLFDAIAAGNVQGYMAEDDYHRATVWVVEVGGIWSNMLNERDAREMFAWQWRRTHPRKPEAKHDAD